jgi:transposase
MAQGRKKAERQESLWISTASIPTTAAHPFYRQVNEILAKHGFDQFVDDLAAPFYKDGGRPGIPVGDYLRMMMIGFFEGIGSERGIAWRVADSLSLRHFLGLAVTDATPDHSSLSVIRRRLSEKFHQRAFQFILTVLGREGQLRGKTLGIDATTVEANAALRELQRKDTKERYARYVKRLAEEAGEPAATAEEVARFDRKRKGKTLSNAEWEHPHDPEARVGRDKHGATDMLYKLEKADDLDTGAIVAVTVQTADTGDTDSLDGTLLAAVDNLVAVLEDEQVQESEAVDAVAEAVGDKGYHSNGTCLLLNEAAGIRTYFSEPERGTRRWEGKAEERKAVYGNRRRIRGERGQRLRKRRGEICERGFSHLCDTGGQRRTFLRGLVDVTKKALIGAMGFNVSLLLRTVFGLCKPRQLGGGGRGRRPSFGPVFASIRPVYPIWAVGDVMGRNFRSSPCSRDSARGEMMAAA